MVRIVTYEDVGTEPEAGTYPSRAGNRAFVTAAGILLDKLVDNVASAASALDSDSSGTMFAVTIDSGSQRIG